MFPKPPLFISDELHLTELAKRNNNRRHWLMQQCDGPVVILAPTTGPNQHYPWAHCYQPVYQDSYLLYLTGINQTGIALVMDPCTKKTHLFLPEFSSKTVFWDGEYFAFGHDASEVFLKQQGIDQCHPFKDLTSFLIDQFKMTTNCYLLIQKKGRAVIRDEAYRLRQTLRRKCSNTISFHDVSDISWKQRLNHDDSTIRCFAQASKRTALAFNQTLKQTPFNSEVNLNGGLIGELLKQSEFGLGFSPIIAKNENACILHYTQNSASIKPNDLILMDFGLRWQSICSDVSRTIPANGKYTDLQKILMDVVLETQLKTIDQISPGVCFDDLNAFAWQTLDDLLDRYFCSKGGRYKREYKTQPHNIGHFLGIQVHDGDSNRAYRSQPLIKNNVITIEPGLYGHFELNGDKQSLGIRIEDNLLITDKGYRNLTQSIPKSWQDIEFHLNK